ncbi:hypothetical protein [Chloroflexus sp.]|uniref:hypothetical protein n=1 Tax=Chloroflexus sp. TaxID=1904827 RepID=UPI00262B284D|nr:hypothetical protein [uncultured Chloroflexus sp.]
MLSDREREALIIGSLIGLAAFVISGTLAATPIWLQLLTVGATGILLCGVSAWLR